MRWATFVIVAAGLLTLQTAVAPFLEVRGVRPDWLLVGVMYFALYARAKDGIIAAWAIGFCADLMTVERMGMISMSYALAALCATSVREYVFRYRAMTQFTLTLCICLMVQTTWMFYRRIMYVPEQAVWVEWSVGALLVSVYTALWAPLLHRLLLRLSRLLGIARPRYSHAGLHVLETHDV
jgi:rod shape-determining protein MreD